MSLLVLLLPHLAVEGLQALVFFLCQAHERAVLWPCHALDVDRVVEVLQVLVGLAYAVVLGRVRLLYISHSPPFLSHYLESRRALTHLLALKADIIVL